MVEPEFELNQFPLPRHPCSWPLYKTAVNGNNFELEGRVYLEFILDQVSWAYCVS